MVMCLDGCNWRGVQRLIKDGVNVNHKNTIGETPLIQAVSSANVKMVQMLLDADAKVNMKAPPVAVGPLKTKYPKGMTALDYCEQKIETWEANKISDDKRYEMRQAEMKEKECMKVEVFPECRQGLNPYSPYYYVPKWHEIKEMLLAKGAKNAPEAPDEGLFGMFG